jgi:chromate reductase
MEKPVCILGIVGSLRKGSFNRALMRSAIAMVPAGSVLEICSLDGIPPFNQDLEESPPQAVKDMKDRIRAADAILFATPEYNYSVPGVLKNAIDWGSRPFRDNVWNGKPCAIMGASTGMMGTGRAQYHLRQSCVLLNMYPLNRPEVLVSFAEQKFRDGVLTDEDTRAQVSKQLSALVQWAGRFPRA